MKKLKTKNSTVGGSYNCLLSSVSELLEQARHQSARAVNAILTATYWEIGRRIVEFEQKGEARAEYGEVLLKKLPVDLAAHFGRGFSERNLEQMRLFYSLWPISQTVPAKSEIVQTSTAISDLVQAFPLPWSHYVRLLSVSNLEVRTFYESEAIRGGWSVRQAAKKDWIFFRMAMQSTVGANCL